MAQVRFLNRCLTGLFLGLAALALPFGCGGAPAGSPPTDNSALGGSVVDSGTQGGSSSTGCNTTFYNADYHYGFDLPSNADELDALIWAYTFAGVRIGVSTKVNVSPPVSLEDYVTGLSQEFSDVAGSKVLSIAPVKLSDGTPAYFVIMTTPSSVDGSLMWDYSLYAIAGPYLYRLSAFGVAADLNGLVSNEASRLLESLCIE
jgi:hypothetical protein